MYVVTESGVKLPVDDSQIGNDTYFPFHQTVGLYTDDTVLKPVWIVELNHRDFFARKKDFELNFCKEIRYDHEPTKEEILWALSAYGCTRGDIAIVRTGYELEMEDCE